MILRKKATKNLPDWDTRGDKIDLSAQRRIYKVTNELQGGFSRSKKILLSQDPKAKNINGIKCLPWIEGVYSL